MRPKLRTLASIIGLLVVACGGAQRAEPSSPQALVAVDDPRLERDPGLRDNLETSLHTYFRFINVPFSRAVCEIYDEELRAMPMVNLHGDAHLEQYAVTSTSRGLTDFDDASTGPAVLDLLRFGVSLELTCEQRGWKGHTAQLFAEFLRGYEAALKDPNIEAPEPAYVARARAAFGDDRVKFLKYAEGLMKPLREPSRAQFERGYENFLELMRETRPDLSPQFFFVKKMGRLELGVGSRLDTKLLLRIEGPSPDPSDDIILEAKEVRDISGIPCVQAPVGTGAFRVLLGEARIGRIQRDVLAHVPRQVTEAADDPPFWVQSWEVDYVELDTKTVQSPAELKEIAFDVGVQLGIGHTTGIASPFDDQLRHAQRVMLERNRWRFRKSVEELAERARDGWKLFKQQ